MLDLARKFEAKFLENRIRCVLDWQCLGGHRERGIMGPHNFEQLAGHLGRQTPSFKIRKREVSNFDPAGFWWRCECTCPNTPR